MSIFMEKLKDLKRRLIWIINFINLDIDKLSEAELIKLTIELPQNIRSLNDPWIIEELQTEARISQVTGTGLRKIDLDDDQQSNNKTLISSLTGTLRRKIDFDDGHQSDSNEKLAHKRKGILNDEPKSHSGKEETPDYSPFNLPVLENRNLLNLASAESKSSINKIQKKLKIFLEKVFEAKNSFKKLSILIHFPYPKEVIVQDGKMGIQLQKCSSHQLEFELAELLYECSPEQELNGWRSLKYIKRCGAPKGRGGEKCNNFFLQLHKKEKNYCSTKCAWRAYIRIKRKIGGKSNGATS